MDFNYHKKIEPQFNCMPPRAHYIPFGSAECENDKSCSDRVTVLDKWRFQYFPCPSGAELLSEVGGEEIAVPSNWQTLGYDAYQYTNMKYPFPYDPPNILKDNPAGVYVTRFKRQDKNSRHYIVFEGVDSCVYLFVNNEFAGYSSVSHCHSEFDITGFLKDDNEIRAVVFKWCSGSYLEDQDKMRLSGIFRDVYIVSRPEGHIFDYGIKTFLAGKNGVINFSADRPARLELYLDGRKLYSSPSAAKLQRVQVPGALLWDSEHPRLYTLIIESGGEYICEKIGFRTVEWEGGVLKLNGKPLKFKGVNRHSVTVNGYVETEEDMLKDIRLFKQYNINAVRTSHYPPPAEFLKLCDEYGIYVMDEADIETHGSLYANANLYFAKQGYVKQYKELCEDPVWYCQFRNRVERMYARDRNRVSVVMWSLGNEAGFGENFIKAGALLKAVDASRPIHYEGTRTYDDKFFHPDNTVDVYSWMYPGLAELKELLRRKPHRPVVLCEYTHAMGNSCGDAAAYWDLIYNAPELCGAFVWEWAEHTVSVSENGKIKALYGGDFGDFPHDSNFCADGLVSTDRTPHPSFAEIKEVYAPFDVRQVKDGYQIIMRDPFFDTVDAVCRMRYELDGKTVREREISLDGLDFSSPLFVQNEGRDFAEQGYAFVNFDFGLRQARPLLESGHLFAGRQIQLNYDYAAESEIELSEVALVEKDGGYTVSGEGFSYTLDRNGLLNGISTPDGIIPVKTEFNFLRAFIDNDKNNKFIPADFRTYFFITGISADKKSVTVEGKSVAPSECPFCGITLKYSFAESGDIAIDCFFRINPNVEPLPRLGMKFAFDGGFSEVEYFGRGGVEAYEDRISACPVGLAKSQIEDMFFHYTKPQETGSHCGTRFAVLTGEGGSLMFDSEKDFSFSVNLYDEANYPAHDYELEKSGKVILCIDYRMSGIGSASCGPTLDPRYKITEKEARLSFRIRRNPSDLFKAHRVSFRR